MKRITEKERNDILQTILDEFHRDERIESVMLAGSTATGFKDRFSDIDVIVITGEEHFEECWKQWSEWMEQKFRVLNRFGGPLHATKYIVCYLLEGYLEVDLVFEARISVSPRTARKIVFDRSGTLEKELDELADQKADDREEQYLANVGNVWYNILHANSALARGTVWRAYNEVLQMIFKTAELAGIRYGVDTEDLQSIELLPDDFVQGFKACLPSEITVPSLTTSLRNTIVVYFDQAKVLDERFSCTAGQEMEALFSGFPEKFDE